MIFMPAIFWPLCGTINQRLSANNALYRLAFNICILKLKAADEEGLCLI
jgi:hypothetical protein